MQKSLRILTKIIQLICIAIILWFPLYFFWGDRFSITFTNRCFASWFPQILAFGTAASIYILFILSIKSKNKRWQNVLLFVGGLLLATIPLIVYHGYLQYQCGIWNREIVKETPIYYNKTNKFETVKVIQSSCDQTAVSDTVFVKQMTPWFELQNPVNIHQSDDGNWTIIR